MLPAEVHKVVMTRRIRESSYYYEFKLPAHIQETTSETLHPVSDVYWKLGVADMYVSRQEGYHYFP